MDKTQNNKAWFLAVMLVSLMWFELPLLGRLDWPVVILGMATMALVATGALSHLGLESSHAARDIHELRDLLEAWRDARRTAWQTVIKVITTGILAALLVGAAIKLKLMGGGQ